MSSESFSSYLSSRELEALRKLVSPSLPMVGFDVAEAKGKNIQNIFSISFDQRGNGELALCKIFQQRKDGYHHFDKSYVVQDGKIIANSLEDAAKFSLLLQNICYIQTIISDSSLEILSTTHMRLFGGKNSVEELYTVCKHKHVHSQVQYPKQPIEYTGKGLVLARDGAIIKQTTEVKGESASYQITSSKNTIYNVLYVKNSFYSARYMIKLEKKEIYPLVMDVTDIQWIESVVQDYSIVQNFRVIGTTSQTPCASSAEVEAEAEDPWSHLAGSGAEGAYALGPE